MELFLKSFHVTGKHFMETRGSIPNSFIPQNDIPIPAYVYNYNLSKKYENIIKKKITKKNPLQ